MTFLNESETKNKPYQGIKGYHRDLSMLFWHVPNKLFSSGWVSELKVMIHMANSNNTAPSIGTIAKRNITTGLFGLTHGMLKYEFVTTWTKDNSDHC
jgi:hypothetical protein